MSETPVQRLKPGRYASIDIGTVTCRMLVADIDDAGRMIELDKQYRITNLGEDTDKTHRLAPAAIERVAQTVEGFAARLADFEPADGSGIKLRAIATSASRDAENAAEFAERMRQVGIVPAVIPGEREASLSFRGASSCFAGCNILVADVGGGSTEIVAGAAGADPSRARSFNIGCRRATEKLLASDPPTPSELGELRAWVAGEMAPYYDELRAAGLLDGRFVAVAGTATSVVSIREGMQVYDSARVQGAVVSREGLNAVLSQLAALTVEERKSVVGLDPGRAPVIVAGLVILDTLLELGGYESYTASEADILQGVILELASE